MCDLEQRIKAAVPAFQLSTGCTPPPPACEDDGNPLTNEVIVGGSCVHIPVAAGTPCSPPAGGHSDENGNCVAPPPACEDDGNPLTNEVIVGGNCVHIPVAAGTPCSPPAGGHGDENGNCVPAPARVETFRHAIRSVNDRRTS
jgi:hypothetical protein